MLGLELRLEVGQRGARLLVGGLLLGLVGNGGVVGRLRLLVGGLLVGGRVLAERIEGVLGVLERLVRLAEVRLEPLDLGLRLGQLPVELGLGRLGVGLLLSELVDGGLGFGKLLVQRCDLRLELGGRLGVCGGDIRLGLDHLLGGRGDDGRLLVVGGLGGFRRGLDARKELPGLLETHLRGAVRRGDEALGGRGERRVDGDALDDQGVAHARGCMLGDGGRCGRARDGTSPSRHGSTPTTRAPASRAAWATVPIRPSSYPPNTSVWPRRPISSPSRSAAVRYGAARPWADEQKTHTFMGGPPMGAGCRYRGNYATAGARTVANMPSGKRA